MGTRIGGLWTANGSDSVSLSTPEHMRQWENAVDWGADAQLEQDAIRVKVPGLYLALANLTFEGDANVTYYAEIRVNDVSIASGALIAAQEVVTADRPVNLIAIGAGILHEGDMVSVYVGSDAIGGANFTLRYGQFGIFSL